MFYQAKPKFISDGAAKKAVFRGGIGDGSALASGLSTMLHRQAPPKPLSIKEKKRRRKRDKMARMSRRANRKG